MQRGLAAISAADSAWRRSVSSDWTYVAAKFRSVIGPSFKAMVLSIAADSCCCACSRAAPRETGGGGPLGAALSVAEGTIAKGTSIVFLLGWVYGHWMAATGAGAGG